MFLLVFRCDFCLFALEHLQYLPKGASPNHFFQDNVILGGRAVMLSSVNTYVLLLCLIIYLAWYHCGLKKVFLYLSRKISVVQSVTEHDVMVIIFGQNSLEMPPK